MQGLWCISLEAACTRMLSRSGLIVQCWVMLTHLSLRWREGGKMSGCMEAKLSPPTDAWLQGAALGLYPRFALRPHKLSKHKYICTYLHSRTQTHTSAYILYPDSWCASRSVAAHSLPLWKVLGWLLSDVRLICNSSSFCSDKWVGVLRLQEDRWGREGRARSWKNTEQFWFWLWFSPLQGIKYFCGRFVSDAWQVTSFGTATCFTGNYV